MADGFARLNEIIRDHHYTGAYAGCILRVHPDVHTAIVATSTPSTPAPSWSPPRDPMKALFGIPIVIDNTLLAGSWRLMRAIYTGEVPRRVEVEVESGDLVLAGEPCPACARLGVAFTERRGDTLMVRGYRCVQRDCQHSPDGHGVSAEVTLPGEMWHTYMHGGM